MGEAVRETYVTCPSNTPASLCKADPSRRMLLIGVPIGQQCLIGLSTAIMAGVSNVGYGLNGNMMFKLTTREDGLLTCLQWYGVSTGPLFQLAVYEVYDPSISYPPSPDGGLQPLGTLSGIGGMHERDMSLPDPIHEMIVQLGRLTRKLRG